VTSRTKVILVRELELRMSERDPLREDYRQHGDRWLLEYDRRAKQLRAELAEVGIDADTFDTSPAS
jgi:hypothetical protein